MNKKQIRGFQKLLKEVYDQGAEDSEESSKYPIFSYVSDILTEKKIKVSGKTIVRKYDASLNNDIKELSSTRSYTIKALCQFVGYENFSDYLDPNVGPNKSKTKSLFQLSINISLTISSTSEELLKKLGEFIEVIFKNKSTIITELGFSKNSEKHFLSNQVLLTQKWELIITDKDLFYNKTKLIEEELKSLYPKDISIERIEEKGKIIIFDANNETKIIVHKN